MAILIIRDKFTEKKKVDQLRFKGNKSERDKVMEEKKNLPGKH